jgi:hypothetical protein
MADSSITPNPENGRNQDAKNKPDPKKIQPKKEEIDPLKARPMRIRGVLYEIGFWILTGVASVVSLK